MTYRPILWLSLVLGLVPSSTLAADSLPVPDAPNKICPLLIGSPVPPITLQTLDGEAFDLNARLKNRPTILIYFRGGW